MRSVLVWVIGSAIIMIGCGRSGGLQSKAAIRQAVEAHLKGNSHLSLDNFTTQVESVKFNGDTADALVRFQGKELPGASVQVRYQLKKAGDRWEVTSSSPAGGQGMDSHTGMAGPPPASGSSKQDEVTPQSSH